MDTYKIVRHYHPSLNRKSRAVRNMKGLSLEEAQAHCQDPKTHNSQYFDAYHKEGISAKMKLPPCWVPYHLWVISV